MTINLTRALRPPPPRPPSEDRVCRGASAEEHAGVRPTRAGAVGDPPFMHRGTVARDNDFFVNYQVAYEKGGGGGCAGRRASTSRGARGASARSQASRLAFSPPSIGTLSYTSPVRIFLPVFFSRRMKDLRGGGGRTVPKNGTIWGGIRTLLFRIIL